MFAPPVREPETKPTASSNNKSALQFSTFLRHRFGAGAVERAHLLQRSLGNQATLRPLAQQGLSFLGNDPGRQEKEADASGEAVPGVSWNFSNIPVFAPDRMDRAEAQSLLTVPPLPGGIQANLKIEQVKVGQVNDTARR